MWRRWLMLIGMTALVMGASPSAAPLSSDELELNRRYIERVRNDPERYHLLLSSLQEFNQLPLDQQERIRQLDRQLHEEPSYVQSRLLRTADRYADWLARLPIEQQRRIKDAPDRDRRLETIREIRQQQWIEHLPRPQRERIQSASGSERQSLIERYRSDERKRNQEWLQASKHWDELLQKGAADRLEKFPSPVQDFVKETLLPRLTIEEKERLRKVEGRWPDYPRTLVELTDRNTFKLLHPASGPTKLEELPEELQKRLRNVKLPELGKKKKVMHLHTTWVDFAEDVTKIAKKNNIPLPMQLGPCFPKDFTKPIPQFINQKLMSFNSGVLDKVERERLKQAEGYWPLYPYTVLELARKHHLSIPGTILPGPVDFWDKYRDGAGTETPVVSARVLLDFAMNDLTEEERATLHVTPGDPASREALQQEYIRRHPDEWRKLVQSDQQKQLRKKADGKSPK